MDIIILPEAPTPLIDVSNGGTFFILGGVFIKKPKTYDQQIAILKNKNIAIIDDVSAKTFLKQVNYYRFSGYFLPFQINGHGSLFPNITFERLQAIYEFDEQLRNLIAGVVDEIEVYLRSQLAYYHAHKYGEEGYMDACNYNNKHDHIAFTKRINSCIKENARTTVVQHHMKKYNGHFPIWVIIEFFSFGTLFKIVLLDISGDSQNAVIREIYSNETIVCTTLYVKAYVSKSSEME